MPCVGNLLIQSATAADNAESPSQSFEPAESIPLYLPSSVPQRLRKSSELSGVIDKERRLRVAQAEDALADIRRQRRIISGLWHFKKLNVDGTGNRTCTRIRALYNRFSLRTQQCAGRYRAARSALVALDPDGSWQLHLRELKDNDIRGPGKDDGQAGSSRFEPSWIWLVRRVSSAPDMGNTEEALDDSLRVEWSRSHARKDRWEEEVLIIQEEMRRVITYHEWKAEWWRSRAMRRSGLDAATLQGVAAYAEKQAHLSEQLAQQCAIRWVPALKEKGILPEWGERYSTFVTNTVTSILSAPVTDEQEHEGIDDGGLDGFEDESSEGIYDEEMEGSTYDIFDEMNFFDD